MRAAHFLITAMMFMLPLISSAQEQAFDQVTSRAFLQQLAKDGIYYFISKKVAESLITHRVDFKWPIQAMEPRVEGTVIVAFEITIDGHVRYPMAVSGPTLLRQPVVNAISQWRFKPYQLHGRKVAVATSYPMHVSNF